jgi:hypothetical protein
MDVEAEVSPATKQVEFVDCQSTINTQWPRRMIAFTPTYQAPNPTLNRAERKTYREFLRRFRSRIAKSGNEELEQFDLSDEEECDLEEISDGYGPSTDDKKKAEIALFWCNTEQQKLYEEIMQVLQTFETQNLRIKAVNECMKLAANCRGSVVYLRAIPGRCKELDAQGVEFMFWDSASKCLGMNH